ncbi:Sacsin [Dissostichus eleginoides]|uniref:Sacsin n=1 Tax=Dissostichus eleginoides TaxID=100907 RepID=A0AAD9CL46_DISEL|nr:Sacsin [Dissostichus eleginoides]
MIKGYYTTLSGPALYAYNNAAFTDEDWEGIQMAGRSVKRNDPNKVGRFGIGFNSVYHITDVPSIFSSDHLGMMDPQEKIFGQRNSDNRREIKWQEEDQQHDEHAVWNELLMKEVLPQAYIMIIQDAINLAQQDNLPVSSVQNVAVLSLAKDEREFITPSEAVFPCSVASAIVEAYPHLDTLKHVTPAFIRGSLRRIDVHTISKPDKLCLLEFILSDEKYRELEGLQLLPLNDGSFRSFTDREEDTALIDSNEFPRVLLPFCKHLFIPDNLRPACSAHLKELARENIFKVINIDAKRVAEYTKRFLPQDWKQMSKGHVTWDVSSNQHPPLEWLQEFWTFLNTHFKELSHFIGLPLIPVSPLSVSQPVSLATLEQKTTLIFQRRKQMNLPEKITELVNKLGGTAVRENDWLKHDDLDSYVLCPSPRSVMKVLVNLDSQNLIRDLKTASHGAREELKDYLSRLDCLSVTEKDLLSKLPLFQTMNGSCVAAQSKQAVRLMSGLKVPTDFPMPASVVRCATEADRRLLQLLKVKLLDTAEAAHLLIDCIESRACRKEDTEKIMTWILQNGAILFSQNQTLKHRCKDLSFIEVNGELKKPSAFFDPRIKTFKIIFESDFFPPPLYTGTSQMLQSLTDLGLLNKEVDVSPEHFLHAATLIDKAHVDSQTEALNRAQVLLKMLDTNDLFKFSPKQPHRINMLKWIPCTKPGNDKTYGNDTSQRSCFFCPDEIRHSDYEDIVEHVMPLGTFSDRVSSQLGLKRLPPPEKVIENLSALTSKAQKMTDPDTNVDFKRKLHSIYKHMQDHINEFSRKMAKDTHWLWSHDQFVSPQDLVLDYPRNLDLSSYIRKVPNEFLPYKKLLQEFGLKTLLSDQEIVGILHSIQKTIEETQQPFASSSEVKVSIEILKWLWKEKKTVQDDIPVPVLIEGEQHTLKPLSTAVFCDVSKNGLNEINYSQEEVHVVHEDITKAAAEWFNIRFLSTYILDPELVGIEQFGQSEPITTRIKNILKEYDEERDIFKEIIQNAEDAGAEACKFLVDLRVHKDSPESLIDPDMALCQGPCLWAFNNEQFTAEDWKNIVRVGSASKENKVEKIGKFGLGFNTVYHVTDVPSILSGNSLLILDPNVTHLTKHIKHKTNPGIKLDLSKQNLFQCFPGQFGPYERIFDCNFRSQSPPEPYPGTLIKLPFRTEEEAIMSEISEKVFNKQQIITFQQHFTNNSQTHLLFLKNINMLSLQSISNNASTPPRDNDIETVLNVSKTTESTMRIPDESNVSKQQQAEKALMKLDGKCKEVIDCCTVNIVQITSQQSGETEIQSWLLYNCFGTRKSLQMALQENKQAKFSLPIGGIAVPLQKNPGTGKLAPLQTDLVGQAFCFLPLSIHTGLPVNVNGTFAVTSNRKGLWESGLKHEWNKALLEDPVVTAYISALLALKKMSENKQLETYCYHTFWPDREKVSDTFKPLVDALYSAIAQPSIGPELFSDGEHWCSMNSAIFLHKSIEEDKDISELAVQVCKTHVKAPNHVVSLPLWLRNSFKRSGLEKALQNRTWNWDTFYQEAVFNNLDTMDPKSRDTLVLHAIDLNIKELDKLLVRYPCIPTIGGQLQHIRKLVNPSGKVACLFEPEEGRLLGGTKNDFCSPKRIKRLLELGMANDHLPLEEITEKAGTIPRTWSFDKKKACGHLNCLLELMKNHMSDEGSLYWETLRMTEFLPAFSPDIPKKLLRDLGMKHVVSKDDILNFAHQLESEAKGNGDLKDLKPKSSLVFKAALNIQIEDKHEKEMFLEEMADINFLFPVKIKKELQNYHQPFVAERTAVKIRGSLIDSEAKHQELIWSSMPIIHLPVYKSEEVVERMNKAGAHEHPPPNCVTSNMRNICQSPCKDQNLITTRAEVFRIAYAYLQVNTFEVQPLAGLPVVLVEKDKELAKPDDTSFSLPYDHEFRPYLYNISPNDVMFSTFFKQIGVKDKPTAVQYCNVLAAVYADSCEKPHLNPNQLKTVKRAVEQFFLLIRTKEKQSLVDDSMTLYLPAVDGKVYPSCKLYYNDTVFESKRLEKALDNKFLLLEKLSECHLGNDVYEHQRLLRLLPQTFKPNMLSQFTEEKVVESHMQLCELGADCEFSGWFESHLSSEAFIHGLICLIRDQSQGEITQEDATEMCKKTFGSIQIVCCNSLKTELWVNQQPLHQTASQTDVFVKQEQQGCIFYLKHNNNMIHKVISEINMTLTTEINALLGNILGSNHLQVLAHLLTCDSLEDVQKTLAKKGILDSAETQSIFHNPAAPGTEIPVEWHDSLDMNILNNFEEGEYVGYSTNNKYIYAVIVEELPGQSGPYSHRYKIEIGEDEPIEVSCLDLYQFKRQKKPEPKGSSAASTSADTSCMDMVPLEGAVPHSSKPSTTSSSSTRSSPASLEEAKMEIDKCLKEIWTLPVEEKHKAIKRLYLRWHPDKNLDCIPLATEAFKYLQNQIAELSKGKGKGQNTGSSYSSGRSDFRNFYDEWNQEARHHRNARDRFSRSNRSYNSWTHNENVPRPNKEEAQRWRRQARCDLDAAYKDVSGASTEWCLFKVHQAVEKSLTAAKYKKDGQHPTSSSILSLAAQVSLYNLKLRVLPQIVRNLKALGVDDKKTQYPNCHPFPHIPNEQFKPENELLALESASELLSLVEEYVN